MEFKSYKYTSFLSTGEIMESDSFRSIYNAARFTARNYDGAAVIFRNSDSAIVCTLWYGFSHLFIWRGENEFKNKSALLKAVYIRDEYGKFCWDYIGERV